MCNKSILRPAFMFATAALLALPGCAAFRNDSDANQIRALLVQWKQAYLANDVPAIMELCADDYAYKGKDKAAAAKMVGEYLNETRSFDTRVNIDDATVTLRGDRATVLPIALSGIAGSDSGKLELIRKDGRWQISGMAF